MRTGIAILTAALAVALFATGAVFAQQPGANVIYVSPSGNDAWSGALADPAPDGSNGPFATPAAAQAKARALIAEGKPIRVVFRAGTYVLPNGEPLVFTPEDSGKPRAGVSYQAYRDEKPVISGGRKLEGWRQEGELWVADVPEAKGGAWRFGSLWVNGERRTVARTPNDDYFHLAGKAPDAAQANTAFVYTPGDIAPYKNLIEDAVIVVYHSWATSLHHVKSLDEQNHLVTFTGPAVWPFAQWDPQQRYHVENVIEALDLPGEWCLDTKEGRVYYKPMPGEDMGTAEVIAPVAKRLVRIKGSPKDGKFVEHLTLQGLTFAHNSYPIPDESFSDGQAAIALRGAIDAVGARHCAVRSCTISHIDTYGIWFGAGCQDNVLSRNEITDMGGGGIAIGEPGNPSVPEEAVLRNVASDNRIQDGGNVFRSAVGVWIGRSSFNRVSHNEISDLLYTGVSVGWSWGYDPSSAHHNVIEYNHIHDIGKSVLSDMGGIYLLGIAPGTTCRYNLIHDVSSYAYGGWGIYPDEGSSYLLIENNVVYNTKTGGFHQHYGRGNVVTNNIFAFSKEGQVIRTREEAHPSFFFERNIVLFDNGKLLGSNWGNGNYWIDSNVYWDTSNPEITFAGMTFDEWKAKGRDANSVIADPMFVDPAAHDFTLKPESPALKLGFNNIDISQAGPRERGEGFGRR
ncbi:MAG: right-handed parallel beta-helix repeat-containing protein [FCB group bacterium]|jgi:parallel beta-helix repeat protein|nr:right-handed parallel beta-helix repeat-containing protein [FCB group bacterium]